MAYRYLWTPLELGPVTARNRIVFSAHLTNYARDGKPTEQHAAYYAARAAGGTGLIITEEHSTHPTDWPYEKLIHGFHRDVIPGYRRITDAVHRHRVPIFAQINHNGGQASSMFSRLPVWAPSAVADPLFREVPKAVTAAEIDEIVAGYALVAEHCAEGGFDGIELQCSHSSIVRGFLSPRHQPAHRRVRRLARRTGPGCCSRSSPPCASVIGNRLALGVRLCGDELIEGGTTIDDAVEVARIVEATGQVDYINTSIGVATASLFMIEASMHIPPGYAMFIPSAIRKAVDLPVVGVGRFKDPLQAERALAEGHCDLVGVVRGQIADADFAAKARAGATDEIRLCLSCNQECVGRMGLNRWLGLHREPAHRPRVRASPRRPLAPTRQAAGSVMVVGAGPAGLQAAIAAARNGHASPCSSARPSRRAGAARRERAQPRRARRHGPQPAHRVPPPRRDDRVRRRRRPRPRRRAAARPRHRRHRRRAGPAVVGRRRRANVVRRPRRARRHGRPSGDVVRDRRDRLPPRDVGRRAARRPRLPGRDRHERHGRRPGPRHHARHGELVDPGRRQGHRAVDRPRADGHRRHARSTLLHHPTGTNGDAHARLGRAGRARRTRSSGCTTTCEAAGVSVERVGDCVAPRRAHAAVVEGERAGAAIG